MADVLNRTTKIYIESANTPDYDPLDWIVGPDLSAVVGYPSKYWNISGDIVTLMSQAEMNEVDDQILTGKSDRPDDFLQFGDGSDGDMDISVDTILYRDIYPKTLLVRNGVTLSTAGYRIISKKNIVIRGTVSNDGGAASDAVAGIGSAKGTLGGGATGGAGSTGIANAGGNVNGNTSIALGGDGGNGGGSASVPTGGGAGGKNTSQANRKIRPFRYDSFLTGYDGSAGVGANGSLIFFSGGAGGGSGHGGNAALPSGAGGGGAGVIVLASPNILLRGILSARGGNGGNAVGVDAGGGGGGAGGYISLIFIDFRGNDAVVDGGLGGVGNSAGFPGVSGNAGKIDKFNV